LALQRFLNTPLNPMDNFAGVDKLKTLIVVQGSWMSTGMLTPKGHADMAHNNRRRPYLVAALIATIALGLASRKFPGLFPPILGKYPGDALWAQMVFWLIGMLAPAASVGKVALWSLAVSYADEIAQLYQSPWINNVRATTLGHLVLGSHFSWLDMLSYTIGIALVAPIEWLLLAKKRKFAVA
jgi:hypothetical protein